MYIIQTSAQSPHGKCGNVHCAEGDVGLRYCGIAVLRYCGIAVLSFFSSGISVILMLICGIAVSSSPAVCGFSFFSFTVFGKRRSFTVYIAVPFNFTPLSNTG